MIGNYNYGTGRRKNAVARVFIKSGQGKIVGIMRNNALRLQALIDGLLKLQQAGYASDRIEPVRVRVDELIQQVLATHQLAARDKRLQNQFVQAHAHRFKAVAG